MIRMVRILLAIDVGIAAFCLMEGNMIWLANTQIAFVGSLSVTLGSYLGYRRMIERKLTDGDVGDQQILEKIDDRFELHDDPEEAIDGETIQKQLPKIGLFSLMKFSSSGMLSIFRLFGYGLLIGGFFVLVNRGVFQAVPYFFGLGIVPAAALIGFFLQRR